MKSLAAYPEHGLSGEEKAGLVVALAAHAALVAWLMLNPPAPKPMPVPERMTVTLSDEVAERSTSPEPKAEAAPAVAPVLAPEPAPPPVPSPVARPEPQPQPAPRVTPAPAPQPVPRPAAKAPPQPAPKPVAKPAPPKPAVGGGSRLGADFLKGIAGGTTPGATAKAPAAETAGPAVKAAIGGAIARQLKPHWIAPQGAEAEQLVTVVRFRLARDGSLMGSPEVVAQSGITDANRAQAPRHAEQAIRAVRLAAPFQLPDDYYSSWQVVTSRFDKRLSQ